MRVYIYTFIHTYIYKYIYIYMDISGPNGKGSSRAEADREEEAERRRLMDSVYRGCGGSTIRVRPGKHSFAVSVGPWHSMSSS